MKNTKPLAIVISRNYSTGLGVIRSLGAAGYTVDLIASVKKRGSSVIASSSKYVHRSVEVLSPKIQGDAGDGLILELMKYAGEKEKPVLFSVDDFTTSVIDRNREVLKEYFLMPGISGEMGASITRFMDKSVQGAIARECGLLTPLEWKLSLGDDIIVSNDITYPCFVKPLHSAEGRKEEMAVCGSKAELTAHLLEMKSFYENRDVLIQEFLKIDQEYDLSGVCLDQNVIIPAVIEKIRVAQHERGVTMEGKMVELKALGSSVEKIFRMLRRFHYIGMFDMEFNLCGEKLYFNEINFRSGGPNYAYYLNGVNLPAVFADWISDREIEEERTIMNTFGKTFVYEKVAWEDSIYSFMTGKERRECIKGADFTLLADSDDPRPGRYFAGRIRLSALKHRTKQLLRREKRI